MIDYFRGYKVRAVFTDAENNEILIETSVRQDFVYRKGKTRILRISIKDYLDKFKLKTIYNIQDLCIYNDDNAIIDQCEFNSLLLMGDERCDIIDIVIIQLTDPKYSGKYILAGAFINPHDIAVIHNIFHND